jgi:RP/EB family microtubule-associated protein
MATNIGMMDSAYFVGRNEILSWINDRLHLNLSRIEEAASGAVQCQMLDMTFPGVVPMHKVILLFTFYRHLLFAFFTEQSKSPTF